jgi:prepilin-type N-terminal cleavage/methylation domain-containing protein
MMSRPHIRGFSLLELSIVILIISLIVGAGMTMATGALKAADRISTQEKLNSIKLALDSHAKTYGYLPCPADRALTPSAANFGVENRNNYTPPSNSCTAAAPGIVASGSAMIGGVPVRSLGLPDGYSVDAWGNKLTYAVTVFHAEKPSSYSSRIGGITLRFGTLAAPYNVSSQRMSWAFASAANNGGLVQLQGGATGSLANGMVVHVKGGVYNGSYVTASLVADTSIDLVGSTFSATDAGTIEWQEPGTNASYVVISHGPDGRGAFPLDSSSVPATKLCNNSAAANSSPPPCTDNTMLTCIDIANCDDSDATFFDTSYNDGAIQANYFDDFVVWGSNLLFREPVNKSLYPACPVGVCEAWCAACALNYPGAELTAPPTTTLDDATVGITLCKKVLTSNSTDCKASCFWSGRNTVTGYYKCP